MDSAQRTTGEDGKIIRRIGLSPQQHTGIGRNLINARERDVLTVYSSCVSLDRRLGEVNTLRAGERGIANLANSNGDSSRLSLSFEQDVGDDVARRTIPRNLDAVKVNIALSKGRQV